MPFTLAHPAIVIPIHKRFTNRLSLSALVIGSISPDLAYYFDCNISGEFTHTLIGIFLYCLPISLSIYYLYHYLFKNPLITLFPYRITGSYPTEQSVALTAITFPMLALSILVGALTHVFWDSFTHSNMWPVQQFDFLKTEIIRLDSYSLYTYRLLQHASTLLGLGYIFIVIRQYSRRNVNHTYLSVVLPLKWRLLFYLVFIFAGIYNSDIWRLQPSFNIWYGNLFHIITHGISGTIIAIMAYCLFWNGYHYYRVEKPTY